MFNAKTEKIKYLAEKYPQRISELEKVFDKKTNVYIDFANAIRWQEKLHWHFDLRRLKQFLDSFENINSVKFYSGTLIGNEKSETFIMEVEKIGYNIHTKPVKIMKLSIDVSSIPENSLALLENFIRKSLLKQFDLGTIEHLNKKLKERNAKGIKFVEDRKCNFDVEIGVDMLLDYEKNGTETFVLWSGDSDFADPLERLLKAGKKAILFGTAGRISSELNALRETGLHIFDVFHLKEFICWKKELN